MAGVKLSPLAIAELAFGMNGFDIISNETAVAGAGNYTEVDYWVAFKAIDGDAEVEAASNFALDSAEADHFTLDGTTPNSDQHVTVAQGDVIYGDFREIRVASGDYVIAYRGPNTDRTLNSVS